MAFPSLVDDICLHESAFGCCCCSLIQYIVVGQPHSMNLSLSNCISNFKVVPSLRSLLPLLLQYDSTAEESDTSEAPGVGISVQTEKNLHATRAAQALSRLSGLCTDGSSTPYNLDAAEALKALLTPNMAGLLKDLIPKDLLSLLNTNLQSPEVTDNKRGRNSLTYHA